ncbi:MAG: protein-L-isoaspartate(D-aspartate) O-methyltransferase [Planctomycetes bacterium]|nr:protein-L-isoaspartate(D-aspartate) O-methyltransferase [Planctomycetota bacterium]
MIGPCIALAGLAILSAACRPAASPGGETDSASREAELRRQREALAAKLAREIDAPRVIDAIARVPRHEFVPEPYTEKSYEDTALPIAEGQSISRPYVVARMTQLLDLQGDEKVLEVGTGSGYQAAILACLAAEVYSIEIRRPLEEAAEKKLEDLMTRRLLRCRKLEVIGGDGSRGYPAAAPFDAILVTAASDDVPEALLGQLKPGGRLVIPVGGSVQELRLVTKKADGTLESRNVQIVRFVRLEEEGKN